MFPAATAALVGCQAETTALALWWFDPLLLAAAADTANQPALVAALGEFARCRKGEAAAAANVVDPFRQHGLQSGRWCNSNRHVCE